MAEIHRRNMLRACLAGATAAAALGALSPASAQDGTADALQLQIDQLTQQNDLSEARLRELELDAKFRAAEVDRITSLGLPTFDGTTELKGEAGQSQVALLATAMLADAAENISIPEKALVLAAGETAPGADIELLASGLNWINETYIQVSRNKFCNLAASQRPPRNGQQDANATNLIAGTASVGTAIAAISAVAGLFRTDTTYQSLSAPNVNATLLADILALKEKGRRPTTPLPPLSEMSKNARLFRAALAAVENGRIRLQTQKTQIEAIEAKNRGDLAKCLTQVTSALGEIERFETSWLKPDAAGDTRFLRTARLLTLIEEAPAIVTVDVQAGGSAVTTKNLLTTLSLTNSLHIQAEATVRWTQYDRKPRTIGLLTMKPGATTAPDIALEFEDTDLELGEVSLDSAKGELLHCATEPMTMRKVGEFSGVAGRCISLVRHSAISSSGQRTSQDAPAMDENDVADGQGPVQRAALQQKINR